MVRPVKLDVVFTLDGSVGLDGRSLALYGQLLFMLGPKPSLTNQFSAEVTQLLAEATLQHPGSILIQGFKLKYMRVRTVGNRLESYTRIRKKFPPSGGRGSPLHSPPSPNMS